MHSDVPKASGEPIAVIGGACRFPGGATSPSKLWDLLSKPYDVLSKIPDARFNPDGFYHPHGDYHGHSNVKHAYLLQEDHRLFDADFFNVSTNEANAIDPQQRVLMECVYEALEDAGQQMNRLKGSNTAVYVGLMCEEYSDLQSRELDMIPTYFPTGTARSVVSNRISYFFDWRGPSMTIDTACSSSLVAVHQAVQTLRSGSSNVAIAAGANLILGPEPFIAESTFHMLSPRGRSNMWDADADGYARGDGVAVVVLKRLADAIAVGDMVDYVIRETGVNQDGRTKGITVPNVDAQAELIQQTYLRAGLDLSTPAGRPQFFEAHGTGTLAGDPVEAEAIHRAIGSHISKDSSQSKLLVGSIKSVIGHTEGTAGIAGLMKVGQALHHGKVPPNLMFKKLNPAIEPFYGQLQVVTEPMAWPEASPGQPRRASVNSFGFGGTNAHAIVENWVAPRTQETEIENLFCLAPFTFSANSKSALKRYLESMVDYLEASSPNLVDLGYTLHSRRTALPFRAAYCGSSVDHLRDAIAASLNVTDWESSVVMRAPSPVQILGVFTGQGAQWAGMGRELLENSSFARARLEYLESALAALPPADRPAWSLSVELTASSQYSKAHTAEISQPVCTALQILLVDLLRAAGITFTAVVGHSSGEIACAYASGFLSDSDAIVIAYYRGLHSHLAGGRTGERGAMIAVGTSPKDAEGLCALPQFENRLTVAAYNSPASVTLSGDADAVEEAKIVFEEESKFARVLRVDKAYHSHHMESPSASYASSLQQAGIQSRISSTGCTWYSSVHAGQRMNEMDLQVQYWCDNMRMPVNFSAAIQEAMQDAKVSVNLALEVGPHAALKGPVTDMVKSIGIKACPYVSCLIRNRDSRVCFTNALGELWKNGAEDMLVLDKFELDVRQERTIHQTHMKSLPSYQWDHERPFWHESRRSKALRTRSRPGHPLLGSLSPDSTEMNLIWHNVLRLSELPWLNGHQLQGQTVFPAAGYVALAIEAGLLVAETGSVQLIEVNDLEIGKAIVFENERIGVETLFFLTIQRSEQHGKRKSLVASFRAYSTAGDGGGATTLNATGNIKVEIITSNEKKPSSPLLPAREPCFEDMLSVNEDAFYSELAMLGYHYSGPFRALHCMTRKFDQGRGQIHKPQPSELHISEQALLVHPGLLDTAFQAIFLAYSWPGDGRLNSLHVPVSIQQIRVDVPLCLSNTEEALNFDSVLVSDRGLSKSMTGLIGDVDIFSSDENHGLIQVEGIQVVPFAPASAAQDTQMFFESISSVAFPDGDIAMAASGNDTVPDEELAMGWILERISYFYLQRLVREIGADQEKGAAWHHQKLMAYARHVVEAVQNGEQPYGKREWTSDTSETIHSIMHQHQHKIEVRLMRSVGEHLPAAVRGETVILEHMRKDGMLDQYYSESLGLRPFTEFLAQVVGQITHVHPHLRLLEIGAGTGGATKGILRTIDTAFDRYTFTDISPGFFETAKGVFAPYAGRMLFEVLDAEKDVVQQGFEEHSYDLVIASLVLHATADLEYTLRNVRRLLRPGGFLVMLEVTANDTMRMSFTMGGLTGWWVGADSGRPWSPCVTEAQWHNLLLGSGYTGIEANTRAQSTLPRPFGVLVSRAIDQNVELLVSPSLKVSPLSTIEDVIIVAGSSLDGQIVARDAQRLLRMHCASIQVVQSLSELATTKGSPRTSLLNLADWAEPVFKNLSRSDFAGIKSLFSWCRSIVWATRGRQRQDPYSNVSVGFCRAMMMEYPRLQLLLVDFDPSLRPSAQVLVDELLRMKIHNTLSHDSTSHRPLWSEETELLIDATGRRWVQRVKPQRHFNNYYNSSRRAIQAHVDPGQAAVQLVGAPERLEVVHLKISSAQPPATARVKVLFSSNTPLRVSWAVEALYLAIGINERTQGPVVVFAEGIASRLEVPEKHLRPYLGSLEDAPGLLKAISSHLLAEMLCRNADTHGVLLLLDPDPAFAKIMHEVASRALVKFDCVTTSMSTNDNIVESRSIHPYTKRSASKHLLSSHFRQVFDCKNRIGQSNKLPAWIQEAKAENIDSFRSREISSFGTQQLLENTLNSITEGETDVVVFHAEELGSQPLLPGAILNWTITEAVPVFLTPLDATPLLRQDRTYLLVGLAGNGGLGWSLAEYFVQQGARYVVMTSRHPSNRKALVEKYASLGVRIAAISNDVTDEVSLRELVKELRASWPPIAGVANGAMVLHDTPLETMSYEQMAKVLEPKVMGSRILDDIFHNDPLDFFVMFSSLASVFGNSGQSNYSAANMYMATLAAQRRQRGVAASVIHIGAIMGTGYMAREVSDHVLSQLVDAGYRKMSERDFHLAFASAIIAGQVRSNHEAELITGLFPLTLGKENMPVWSKNPRFQHVLLTDQQTDAVPSSSTSQVKSVRSLLEQAHTPDDITHVLEDAILEKLNHLLQLSSEAANNHNELLNQRMDSLGIDSLIAVEIRSWMLRDLDLEVPVLQILGDGTVRHLVNLAQEKLPATLVPNLGKAESANLVVTSIPKLKPSPASASLPVASPSTHKDYSSDDSSETLEKSAIFTAQTPSSESDLETDVRSRLASNSATLAKLTDPSSTQLPATRALYTNQHVKKPSPEVKKRNPEVEKTAPFTWGQSRFWVMNHIVQDPTVFNVSCHLEITGPVDSDRLAKAVMNVGARHEALRTCVLEDENQEPCQGVLRVSSLKLEIIESSSSIQGILKTLEQHSYNLGAGEMMRILLYSQSPSKHHLFVGYHHFNMDGTSLVVLMNDLHSLYTGQTPPPPRLQYSDFAVYQLERLRNGHWDDQLTFWRNEFAAIPDPLPLLNVSHNPSRPRPLLTTYGHHEVEMRLPDKLGRQVREASRRLGVTAFHIYCAVFQVLLVRLAAVSEVCIGFADANRSVPGAMESIGNYLNILPLRLTAGLSQPFSSLVRETKRKVLSALANSAVPFDKILSELSVRRSSMHSPLFQAFIDYRYVEEIRKFGTATLQGKKYILSKTPYDIMLDVVDVPVGGASVNILTQESLYTIKETTFILGCYINLLSNITSDTDLPVDQARMFDNQEVDRALQLGQGNIIDMPRGCYLETIDRVATNQPDSIALRDGSGTSLTWSQMIARSQGVAHALQRLQVPSRSRIGMLQTPTVDWLVSMLGIWRAGCSYVPLEITQGTGRLAQVVHEARLAVVIFHDETKSTLEEIGWEGNGKLAVNISHIPATPASSGKLIRLSGEDEAMVFYTSGSTGTPKGISIPHRVIVNSLVGFLDRWPMSPQTVLQQVPLSFDVSWWTALLGLATKGQVVVALQAARRDPQALTRLIVSEGITLSFAVPSETVSWLQAGNLDSLRKSKWTWHFSGGEPYSWNLILHLRALRKPSLRAINVYGPTEAMIPAAHEVFYNLISAGDMPVPIGKIMPNYSVYVVDEQNYPVPAGIPGHFVYAGAGIASGYVNDPSLSANRFPLDDRARSEFLRQGWRHAHRSGDQGYIRPSDGVLVMQHRINGDTQVKIRGLRVDMKDIESNLISVGNGKVSEAVVDIRKPKEEDTSTHFLAAHIVLSKEAASLYPSDEAQGGFLRQLVKDLPLPIYMRPAIVLPVSSLPLNHHGKVDRNIVSSWDLGGIPTSQDSLLPLSDGLSSNHEQQMKIIWQRVLSENNQTHRLLTDTDFFFVGGNSLSLIRIQREIKEAFDVEVPLVQLFQNSTLGQMAMLLSTITNKTSQEIDWSEEVRLGADLQSLRADTRARRRPDDGIIVALTGATGFLGRTLLQLLVDDPRIEKVYCLAVRYPERLDDIAGEKVVVCKGDLASPNLGMSPLEARTVFSISDVVVHNGADTSFMKSYATVKGVNMTSTRDIARLALQHGGVSHFHYVSTAGIAAQLGHDLYNEPIVPLPPSTGTEGYLYSKWASERFLKDISQSSGLRLTIHRPTAIVGPDAPRLDMIHNVLHFSKKLGAVPEMRALEGSFQFVPVATVAQAMLATILTPQESSLSSHSLSSIIDYKNHCGSPEDTVPVHQLAQYLGQKRDIALRVLPDDEWITSAESAGLAPEIASYLRMITTTFTNGQKWFFPRIWDRSRPAGTSP